MNAYELLDQLFNSPNENDWGGKGYLIARIAKECKVTKAEAARQHAIWCEARASGPMIVAGRYLSEVEADAYRRTLLNS